MSPKHQNSYYQFGDFQLDTHEKMLRRGDEVIAIPPKVFDVLCILVERQGGIVSTTEIMDKVWADSFVEVSNLTQNIYTLRRVLGTSDNGKNFIETVPRRGYRFATPVRVVEENRTQPKDSDIIQTNGSQTFSIPTHAENLLPATHQESPKSSNAIFTLIKNHKNIIYFSAVAVTLLIVGFVIFYSSKTVRQHSIENVVFQKLTYTADILTSVISPDGKSFAFVRKDGLFLQDIKTGNSLRLNISDQQTVGYIQFSRDGESLYFRNQKSTNLPGNVLQVSRFGGATRIVAENVWSGFSFSPDSKQIAFVRLDPEQPEQVLIVRNLETGEERVLLSRKPPEGIYVGIPAWSRDGKKISTVALTPQQTQISKLLIIETESGKIEEIKTPRFVQIEQTAWLSSNDSLAVIARENHKFFQLWRLNLSNGEVQKITNDLNIYRALSLSADGKSMLARQYAFYSHIWVAPSDELDKPKQITFGNLNRDGNAGLAWSPDGNLVYCSRITGDRDLWLLRPSDGWRKQLTENAGGYNLNPVVTFDSKYIFFDSTRSSNTRHIWRMDINGDNPTQITYSEKDIEYYPAISPDGNWLYYIQKSSRASAIWRKSLINGTAEIINVNGKISPTTFLSLSPDGKFLAFHNLTGKISEDESSKQVVQIGVISIQERNEPKFFNIAASNAFIQWTSDGKGFDYIENTAEGANLWRLNLGESAKPKLLLNIPTNFLYNFAWSTNGKHLALARGKEENDVVLLTNFE